MNETTNQTKAAQPHIPTALQQDKPSAAQNRYAPMEIKDADFEQLERFIQGHYGIDLRKKRQLIAGRLSVALRQRGFQTFSAYIEHLTKHHTDEDLTFLLDKLTTNYTFFMREVDSLEYFRTKIIPELVRKHQKDHTLSIWSAGCSSGEEPYNISMYLMDYLGVDAKNWDTRLLATDISTQALTTARKGTYHLPDNIPPDWKTKYFTENGDGSYTVTRQIRGNVIFRTFNLMDPIQFQRKFDIIFCRNVMIYFDKPTKDALVKRFYDATVPGGYLMISCSENLSMDIPYRRLPNAVYQK
jgi:chemotaxis protein methyltransferase CheR